MDNPYILVAAYLLFSFSGWLAVVKFFTLPHWERNYFGTGYKQSPGFDLSWCGAIAFGALSLIPLAGAAMNSYWAWVLYQQYRNRHEGKHVFRARKCPVAIKAKKIAQ